MSGELLVLNIYFWGRIVGRHNLYKDNNIVTPPGKFYNCLNPKIIQNARNMVSDSP